jgi:transcription elongation factor SPT5
VPYLLIHFLVLDENWVINNVLSNYINRVKVVIMGTKATQYLDGDYEGKVGRLVALQENPGYEQTARIRLDVNGEERSIMTKFISPQPPTHIGEDVLVLGGKHKGTALVVRETPDNDMIAVSSRQSPADIEYVRQSKVVALSEES